MWKTSNASYKVVLSETCCQWWNVTWLINSSPLRKYKCKALGLHRSISIKHNFTRLHADVSLECCNFWYSGWFTAGASWWKVFQACLQTCDVHVWSVQSDLLSYLLMLANVQTMTKTAQCSTVLQWICSPLQFVPVHYQVKFCWEAYFIISLHSHVFGPWELCHCSQSVQWAISVFVPHIGCLICLSALWFRSHGAEAGRKDTDTHKYTGTHTHCSLELFTFHVSFIWPFFTCS